MDRKLNFVMVAPHFPENFKTFAQRLNESGINVLGIADAEYDSLSDVLKNNLVEYYKVDNMENYDEVYKGIAYFAHKYGKIDRIESHNEYWLELDAKLRTDFNVFGYKNSDIAKIRNKSEMKKIFKDLKLDVAKGRIFSDLNDAKKLVKQLKYPVIIKPDSGIGASDTYKIDDEVMLGDFFNEYNPHIDYIMEEFIVGDIVTFDGLVDHDGKIVYSSSIIYDKNVLETVSLDADQYYYIPRTVDKDLRRIGTQVVEAFNVRERFFHFEFFKTKAGKYIPLEVNMRPPGGATVDMFNYANDFDIFMEYANIVKGDKFSARLSRPYICAYISRKHIYNYKHDTDAIREKLSDDFISVENIPGIFSVIMGDEGFIFKCKTKKVLMDYVNFIHQKDEV